jgi:hypothetical protein
LDLSALLGPIRSVEGGPGRPAIDPRLLMSLWLYATLEGVGSARQLERLCESDAAYRWICGGVSVNHHTLADFRVAGGKVLNDLLSRTIAALVDARIVDESCLAVDGVRVRASAGSSSFRQPARLAVLLAEAERKIESLKAELEADPGADTRRAAQRKLQQSEARKKRLQAAQKAAASIEAERAKEAQDQRRKEPKKKKPPRGSTTDPQARVMKMADGGFRPAYNLQFTTEAAHQLVVGLEVTNNGSDAGQLGPAIEAFEARYGKKPRQMLADGGYATLDDIEKAHDQKVEVFTPSKGAKEPAPAKPQPGDGPGVKAWRERMATEEGWQAYRRRFACERPHADARNRGLQRLLVRGLEKVKAVALWYVTAYNFMQIRSWELQAA